MELNPFIKFCFFVTSLIACMLPFGSAMEYFREKLHGQVGGGNYSYYTYQPTKDLHQEGLVLIYLETLEGDADLYVSDKTKRPTYEIDQHDLQSVTCGLDSIQVHISGGKPLTIAVYGHPSWDLSLYTVEVYVYELPNKERDLEVNEDESDTSHSGGNPLKPPSVKTKSSKTDFEREESIIWTILAGLLKILIEILSS